MELPSSAGESLYAMSETSRENISAEQRRLLIPLGDSRVAHENQSTRKPNERRNRSKHDYSREPQTEGFVESKAVQGDGCSGVGDESWM